MSKDDKEKLKKQKRIEKEKKAKAKLDKRLEKIAAKKKQSGKVTVSKPTSADEAIEDNSTKDSWINRMKEKHAVKKNLYDKKDLKRDKDAKEKRQVKLAFKEFPVKMVKEVSKIKWADKKDLTYKFIEVVIFLIISAAFFYLVDYIFQLIFTAAHVI